jgi:hypothetical protein
MAEERDGRDALDYFLDNMTRLQSDQRFRQVLRELDEGKKETLNLLGSDPGAFLRYRGIEIPQDFRVSVKTRPHDDVAKAGGGGQGPIIICDCIEVCFLRYCQIFCYCKIFEYLQSSD